MALLVPQEALLKPDTAFSFSLGRLHQGGSTPQVLVRCGARRTVYAVGGVMVHLLISGQRDKGSL